MKKLIEQIIKFGMVGAVCTIVDYGLMVLLTEAAGMYYLLSTMISFTVSVIVNYILSMKYVFTSKENLDKRVEFFIYVVLSVIGLGLNQLCMWFMVSKLNVYYMISKIVVTFLVMIYNFSTRKLILDNGK